MSFLHHVNHMRGIAIIPVVIVHSIGIFDWPKGSLVATIEPFFTNVNILFLFVSGYLFAHLSHGLDYRTYLSRKCTNVIVPYVLISIPAILVYLVHLKQHPYLPPSFFDQSSLRQTLFFLTTGAHLGPLWFIPTLSVFYLFSFLFLRLVARPAVFLVLPLWFLAAWFIGRPDHNLGPLHLAAYFAPIYLLGMLCAARRGAVDPMLRRNLGPLLAAAAITAVLSVLLPSRGLPTPHLALKTVICVAIYAGLLSLPDRRIPALDLLARNAFAIFFVHGYLVGFGRLLFDWSSAPVHGTIPLLVVTVVLVLAVSVAIAELTRSTLGRRSRLVLGC